MRWPQRSGRQQVAAAAHRLGAAGDRDVGVAEHDRLGGARRSPAGRCRTGGSASAPASPCGRPPLIAATRERYMSFGSVWMTLPKTTWPTSSGLHLRAAHRFAHHARRQFGRRDVLQAAAVIADRGAHTAHHHYFTSVVHVPLRRLPWPGAPCAGPAIIYPGLCGASSPASPRTLRSCRRVALGRAAADRAPWARARRDRASPPRACACSPRSRCTASPRSSPDPRRSDSLHHLHGVLEHRRADEQLVAGLEAPSPASRARR